MAPVLFSGGVGTVAYLLGSRLPGIVPGSSSERRVIPQHDFRFLSAGAAAFITAFFFLYHVGDLQYNRRERLDICLDIYLDPTFFTSGAIVELVNETHFGELCPKLFEERFPIPTEDTQ